MSVCRRLAFVLAGTWIGVGLGCQANDGIPAGWKSVPLGQGQVIVRLPPEYNTSLEPEETLVASPPGSGAIELRFSLHYPEGPGVAEDIGEQFVRHQARKQGLKVTEIGDKVFPTQTGTNREKGRKVIMHFWQIGFENAVVVMSATVLEDKKDAPEVKECLDKTVPLIVKTLKKP